MRPPEFTGGNVLSAIGEPVLVAQASMRPPEFTGGNIVQATFDRERQRALQ